LDGGKTLSEKVYRALSIRPRREILKLLYRGSLNVEEIAQAIGLQPITVRHHLRYLQEAGLIESVEKRTSTVGRPKTFYRITRGPPIVSFPKRRYLTLSKFLIKTMKLMLGENGAKRVLEEVGKDVGKDTIRKLESEHEIKEWELKTYKELFIGRYLEESGAEPEIVSADDKKIVYRLHNCLFLELALKMPETVCNTLHDSYHQGVTNAMHKKIKIIRTKCLVHSDPYCEHVITYATSN
jgi:DeoR family suf operon transcriptional repressor